MAKIKKEVVKSSNPLDRLFKEEVVETKEVCNHTNRTIVDSKEVCKDCGKVF